MNIVEKNAGDKISYTISGNKITFNDELTFNLERYERDDANHIDVCRDRFGNLVSGVIPGVAEAYVAQIDIPAREYTNAVEETETGETAADVSHSPVSFDIDRCTLTLWALV